MDGNLSADGSAALLALTTAKYVDGSIGQGSGGDGNIAEASRAKKEEEEYASLHNPMPPSLCRFTSDTEVAGFMGINQSDMLHSPTVDSGLGEAFTCAPSPD
jgi:hypothetical protein